MPPMSETMDILGTQTRKTNFSIDAIMANQKIKVEESDIDEDAIDVGREAEDMVPQLQLETKIKTEKISKENRIKGRSTCSELDGVKCTLDNKELWDKFCEFGTEMIITRTGRRMFPTVRVSFSNLETEPGTKYLVLLDIVPCDNKRYRYAYHRSAWLVAGKADPPPPHRLYAHPDGPFTGEQLKKQVISFEKVKVTNNETDNTGQVILNSMHKFQPRVYLVRRKDGESSSVSDIESEEFRSFVFPETQFTAVTAYQNQLITKLKIESNPFAKGFRDSSSQDGDESYSSPFGFNSLPGGMPGLDPFSHLRGGSQSENNNLMEAAEKARLMMMYRNSSLLSHGIPRPPPLPSIPHLPLPPDLLARYSAMQATLGLYNPSFLAAALRSSAPTSIQSQILQPSRSMSPKSRDLSGKPSRFSPYVLPSSRSADSPSHQSTASDGEPRSPSPRSSPPAHPPFSLYR